MPKISSNDSLGAIKEPKEFIEKASTLLSDIIRNVNGNLTFGDNIKCQIVSADFNVANAQVAIRHGLNKTGVNYFPINKSAACDVFTGSKPATNEVIYLQGTTVASVSLVLF